MTKFFAPLSGSAPKTLKVSCIELVSKTKAGQKNHLQVVQSLELPTHGQKQHIATPTFED
jgi:hypothetical protein